MSTILDALRRLERDRDERETSAELRRAVAKATGEAPRSRRSRRVLWIALFVGLVFGSVAYVVFFGPKPDGESVTAQSAAAQSATAKSMTGQATPQPTARAARTPQARARRARAARPESRAAPGSTATPFGRTETAETPQTSGVPPVTPRGEAPASTPVIPTEAQSAVRPESVRALSAKPTVSRSPQTPPAARPSARKPLRASAPLPTQKTTGPSDPPESARRAVQAPAPVPAEAKRSATQPAPAEAVARKKKKPDAAPPAEPPEIQPGPVAPRVVKAGSASSAEAEGSTLLSPIGFPKVIVESVRWHPEAARRTARMQVDLAGPLDVREGDMIAGVLIETIRPGAVKLRVGERTRVVPITP